MRAYQLTLGTVLGSLLLTGCGLLDDVGYRESSLEDAIRRVTPSPNDRYRIPRPPIVAVKGNTGIIREESLFLVIVGPNLKKVLADYPEDVEFGVHLAREPRRHFVLETVFHGEETIDLFEGERLTYSFPKLVDAQDVPFADYAEGAPDEKGSKVTVYDIGAEKKLVAEPVAGALVAMGQPDPEEKPRYFLSTEQDDFLVENHDAMTKLMLDYLIAEGRNFDAGVRVKHVFARQERGEDNCVGCIKIQWIKLSGSLYFMA